MTFEPALVVMLGSIGGRVGVRRDRLRTTAPDEEDQDEDGEDEEDDDPGVSTLGALLRHEPRVPHRQPEDQRTILEWIEDNRVWLVPYASALFVVLIELGSVFFAPRPIPPEGHVVLGAFWLFAVGRGTRQRRRQRRRERQVAGFARLYGIPERQLRDEFAEFAARRLRLTRGRDEDA